MKKIMFNDKYGLTKAVLEGRKTMTRRVVPIDLYNRTDWKAVEEGNYEAVMTDDSNCSYDIRKCSLFKIGEVIAIAQAYRNVYAKYINDWAANGYQLFREDCAEAFKSRYEKESGWNNKMFVRADIMPHHIWTTEVRVERLQDISDEDCMKEGIMNTRPTSAMFGWDIDVYYSTPRDAFAALIDKVSGKGTWKSNPFVFVYTFELID